MRATVVKTSLVVAPNNRSTPITIRRMAASMSAYSAMPWASSHDQILRNELKYDFQDAVDTFSSYSRCSHRVLLSRKDRPVFTDDLRWFRKIIDPAERIPMPEALSTSGSSFCTWLTRLLTGYERIERASKGVSKSESASTFVIPGSSHRS
jgi:hypothetical protein